MSSNWRYTVSIPLYIQSKDASEGELVTLFRVNVLLQAPDSSEEQVSKPPFFVLRRYSQFRKLYEELKAQLPDAMKPRAMLPPPKHALRLGSSPELLEARRVELERWLWRLIATPELARAPALKAFLEFDKAMARAQQQRLSALGLQHGSSLPPASSGFSSSALSSLHGNGHMLSAASSEAGDFDDARSEGSYASGLVSTSASALHLPLEFPSPTDSMSQGHALHADGLPKRFTTGGLANAVAMRLGLRLDQRADVRRLVDSLQRRVGQAGTDLSMAVAEVRLLQETNRLLTQRLEDVEAQVGAGSSTAVLGLQKEAEEATARMAAMAATIEELQAACADAEEAKAKLRAVEVEKAELAAHLAEVEATTSSRNAMLLQQVTTLQAQLDEAHQENKELLGKIQEWNLTASRMRSEDGAQSSQAAVQVAELQQQITQLQEQLAQQQQANVVATKVPDDATNDNVTAQLAAAAAAAQTAHAELAALQASAVAEREKARADQTVLAREIKRLRGELSAAHKAKADSEQQLHNTTQQHLAETPAAAVSKAGLEAQLQQLSAECAALLAERSQWQQKAAAESAANAALSTPSAQAVVAELQAQLGATKTALLSAEAAAASAMEEAQAFRSQLASSQSQLEAATAESASLNYSHSQLLAAHLEATNSNAELTSQHAITLTSLDASQAQQSEAAAALASLQAQHGQALQAAKSLQRQLEVLQQSSGSAQQQQEQLHQLQAQLQLASDNSQKLQQQLQQLLDSSQQRQAELQGELEASQQLCAELQGALEVAHHHSAKVTAARDELTQQLSDLTGARDDMQQALSAASRQATELQAEQATAQQQFVATIAALEAELASKTLASEQLQQGSTDLAAEVAALRAEAQHAANRLQQATAEHAATSDGSAVELVALREQLQVAAGQLQQADADRSDAVKLEAEVIALRNQLQQASATHAAFTSTSDAQVGDLRAELEQGRAQLQQITADHAAAIDSRNADAAALHAELEQATAQLEQMTAEHATTVSRSGAEVAVLQAELEQATAELQQNTAEHAMTVSNLGAEVATLRGELEQATAKLQQVLLVVQAAESARAMAQEQACALQAQLDALSTAESDPAPSTEGDPSPSTVISIGSTTLTMPAAAAPAFAATDDEAAVAGTIEERVEGAEMLPADAGTEAVANGHNDGAGLVQDSEDSSFGALRPATTAVNSSINSAHDERWPLEAVSSDVAAESANGGLVFQQLQDQVQALQAENASLAAQVAALQADALAVQALSAEAFALRSDLDQMHFAELQALHTRLQQQQQQRLQEVQLQDAVVSLESVVPFECSNTLGQQQLAQPDGAVVRMHSAQPSSSHTGAVVASCAVAEQLQHVLQATAAEQDAACNCIARLLTRLAVAVALRDEAVLATAAYGIPADKHAQQVDPSRLDSTSNAVIAAGVDASAAVLDHSHMLQVQDLQQQLEEATARLEAASDALAAAQAELLASREQNQHLTVQLHASHAEHKALQQELQAVQATAAVTAAQLATVAAMPANGAVVAPVASTPECALDIAPNHPESAAADSAEPAEMDVLTATSNSAATGAADSSITAPLTPDNREQQVQELSAALAALQAEHASLVDSASSQQASLQQQLTCAEAQLADTQEAVLKAQATLHAVEGELAALQDKASAALGPQQQLADSQAQLAAAQAQVTALQEQLDMAPSYAQHSELQQQLADMKEQLSDAQAKLANARLEAAAPSFSVTPDIPSHTQSSAVSAAPVSPPPPPPPPGSQPQMPSIPPVIRTSSPGDLLSFDDFDMDMGAPQPPPPPPPPPQPQTHAHHPQSSQLSLLQQQQADAEVERLRHVVLQLEARCEALQQQVVRVQTLAGESSMLTLLPSPAPVPMSAIVDTAVATASEVAAAVYVVVDEVRSLLSSLRSAEKQLPGTITPSSDNMDAFLEQLAASNEALQRVAAQASITLSAQPARTASTLSPPPLLLLDPSDPLDGLTAGGEQADGKSNSQVAELKRNLEEQLRGLLGEMTHMLVARATSLNELRCEQFLSQAFGAGGAGNGGMPNVGNGFSAGSGAAGAGAARETPSSSIKNGSGAGGVYQPSHPTGGAVGFAPRSTPPPPPPSGVSLLGPKQRPAPSPSASWQPQWDSITQPTPAPYPHNGKPFAQGRTSDAFTADTAGLFPVAAAQHAIPTAAGVYVPPPPPQPSVAATAAVMTGASGVYNPPTFISHTDLGNQLYIPAPPATASSAPAIHQSTSAPSNGYQPPSAAEAGYQPPPPPPPYPASQHQQPATPLSLFGRTSNPNGAALSAYGQMQPPTNPNVLEGLTSIFGSLARGTGAPPGGGGGGQSGPNRGR